MKMNTKTTSAALAILVGIAQIAALAGHAETYEPKWESLDKRPVPSWWTEAKFGIFIHWGPYAVPAFGNVSKGQVRVGLLRGVVPGLYAQGQEAVPRPS